MPLPSDEMFRAMNKHLKELDNGGYNIGYDGTFSIQRYLSELLYLRQTKLWIVIIIMINFPAPTKEKKRGEKENPGARKRVDVFCQI